MRMLKRFDIIKSSHVFQISFEKGKKMNKIYTAFIFVISAFLISKFLPENTVTHQNSDVVLTKSKTEKEEIAIFAGGCFWCMEHPFEDLPGVTQAISGYTGGEKENATYKKVASGHTRHLEAVKIHFDPEKISYRFPQPRYARDRIRYN